MTLLPPSQNPNDQAGKPNEAYFKSLIEMLCHKRDLPTTVPLGFNADDMQRINNKLKDLFSQHKLEVYAFDTIEQISSLYTNRMNDLNFKPILQ